MTEIVQIAGNPIVEITTSTLPYYPNAPVPTDLGYQGWTYDPTNATTGVTPTPGTLYLAAIPTRTPAYIQHLYIALTVAANGATPGQNWLGAYTSTGLQLGAVDITSQLTTVGQPIGVNIGSTLLQTGYIWLAAVFNASATEPTLACSADAAFGTVNGLLTTSTYRYTSNGTGLTTLPTTITPSSNSGTVMIPYWGATS